MTHLGDDEQRAGIANGIGGVQDKIIADLFTSLREPAVHHVDQRVRPKNELGNPLKQSHTRIAAHRVGTLVDQDVVKLLSRECREQDIRHQDGRVHDTRGDGLAKCRQCGERREAVPTDVERVGDLRQKSVPSRFVDRPGGPP